jgi:hypothetical protein
MAQLRRAPRKQRPRHRSSPPLANNMMQSWAVSACCSHPCRAACVIFEGQWLSFRPAQYPCLAKSFPWSKSEQLCHCFKLTESRPQFAFSPAGKCRALDTVYIDLTVDIVFVVPLTHLPSTHSAPTLPL